MPEMKPRHYRGYTISIGVDLTENKPFYEASASNFIEAGFFDSFEEAEKVIKMRIDKEIEHITSEENNE